MRRIFGVFLSLGVLALGVARVRGQQAMPGKGPRDLQKRLQASFAGMTSEDSPGFAVLLKQDDQVLFEQGYGVRDLRGKSKIDARTNFRLASCTKQFTAMAIMLLVHDGKLRYEDTLTGIFPEFPAYGKKITVRNLLHHTSGLADYEDLMEAKETKNGVVWSEERQIRDAEVLGLLERETHGKFAPGTQWAYSNSGYVVLGLIVTKRSGEPFGKFLQDRIFRKLGMDTTLVYEKGKNDIANRAYGHAALAPALQLGKPDGSQAGGKLAVAEADQSETSATQGDGGVYSNLQDLRKWDDGLRKHTLLSEKEFAAATAPAALPVGAELELAEDAPASLRGKAVSYGFGWFLDLAARHPLMWHYGETRGFKTAILRYLDSNVTVIVLCNRTDLDAGALALRAIAAMSQES